jgi:dienelactone hydrolase
MAPRLLIALIALAACAITAAAPPPRTQLLVDETRHRSIPAAVYLPATHARCTPQSRCRIALLSPGYGVEHTAYGFIAAALADAGFLVVALQSVLPDDPKPGNSGNLFADRLPMWQRGADTLRFARETLALQFSGYDWAHLVLIGHSNGGDLSALALQQTPGLATTLITLDNRRHPLPRSPTIKLLSLRGSDFAADAGVLPTPEQTAASGHCIVPIANARHDDMPDAGPDWLTARTVTLVRDFLVDGRCPPRAAAAHTSTVLSENRYATSSWNNCSSLNENAEWSLQHHRCSGRQTGEQRVVLQLLHP